MRENRQKVKYVAQDVITRWRTIGKCHCMIKDKGYQRHVSSSKVAAVTKVEELQSIVVQSYAGLSNTVPCTPAILRSSAHSCPKAGMHPPAKISRLKTWVLGQSGTLTCEAGLYENGRLVFRV